MTIDLDALEEIANAAPQGEWKWDHGFGEMCNDKECPYGMLVQSREDESERTVMWVHGFDVPEDDAEYATHIAAFDPPTVKALIARLRKAEAEQG